MTKKSEYRKACVKVYHGYGHTHNLIVYGHVFKNKPVERSHYTKNTIANLFHLFRLFCVKPFPGVNVQLHWGDQLIRSISEYDGFFKLEWESETEVDKGWHDITVELLNEDGTVLANGEGKIFVPNSTQYAFISDIDDTVLISHTASIGKRLGVLFSKNPRSRKAFAGVVEYYELLAMTHTKAGIHNPFFYVSASEWNLYNDLNEFFKYNEMPKGVFLLNKIKKWYQLFKTDKIQHEGKLLRVSRILNAFPIQKFILLGDNSQNDPFIYATIVNKYPEKIFAVYIRNIFPKNENITKKIMEGIKKTGTYTCLFKDNNEAIKHSKMIGFIE